MARPVTSVAFLGPLGTFTEEALRSQPDYAAASHLPCATIGEVLEAVSDASVDVGLVPDLPIDGPA